MERFEQRMDDAVSNTLGLPSAMIDYYDAIKLAREADAALASKDAQLKLEAEVAVGVMTDQLRKIDRLTALNTAKGELIEFISRTFIGPSYEADEFVELERLRARIRSLENG